MSLEEYGYDKERFLSLTGEAFDCIICSQVVKNPKECTNCGSMFCGNCIDSWLGKRRECPNRCQVTTNSIRPIGKALMRIYSELDIKCAFYDNCKTVCKIIDLEQHEKVCKLPKCDNFEICGNRSKPEYDPFKVCDTSCLLLTKIKEADGDWSKIYKEVRSHMKDQGQMEQSPLNRSNSDLGDLVTAGGSGGGNNRDGPIVFQWDNLVIGTGINLTENNTRAFLKEGPYMFRTVLGNQPFYGGVHYWELQADPRTENELKIGVTLRRDVNLNTAFCDFEYGFAYYGLGQLRHSSNASGAPYGKKFKKEGVLGIFLDMNRGILSFSLNGEYFGEGFKNDLLKKGPIWPAASLLHCAGCKLITGKPAPQYFLQ